MLKKPAHMRGFFCVLRLVQTYAILSYTIQSHTNGGVSMSVLTLNDLNRQVEYIRWCFAQDTQQGRAKSKRLTAFAIYAAMGHDASHASYQKVYRFMKFAGLVWIPSLGEWRYTDLWRFWSCIEPLYRPHWTVNGFVHMFCGLLYVDKLPVDLVRWMSS